MKFSPLAIAAVTAMSSNFVVLATTPKSQKSAKKVGNSFYGVAVPVDADDAEDTAFLSAESCNFPTGTCWYQGGCDGSNFAVVFDCQGEYCTYMERRMMRSSSTANNGTAAVGFRDDVLSCTSAGTFVFPAMAETTNDENGSSSCRLGYQHGISLDEGTCNQEYKIRIDVGGDDGNPNLMIQFSKDGGKTYYNEEEPRMAEPLGDMMLFRDERTDLQRRLEWSDLYDQAWTTISDSINTAMQTNSFPALEFAYFAEKVLDLGYSNWHHMKYELLCGKSDDSEFLRVVTAIGCACKISYDDILPIDFLDDLLDNLTGRPTTACLQTFYKHPPPEGIECVSWIMDGCLKL